MHFTASIRARLALTFYWLSFVNNVFSRWVHLLCALYTPDVAFVKPEQLQCVTLSELPPYKWGAKVLCFTPSLVTSSADLTKKFKSKTLIKRQWNTDFSNLLGKLNLVEKSGFPKIGAENLTEGNPRETALNWKKIGVLKNQGFK